MGLWLGGGGRPTRSQAQALASIVVGTAFVVGGLAWFRAAERDAAADQAVLEQGIAAQAMVTRRWSKGSQRSAHRYYLEVAYFTDSYPGPPWAGFLGGSLMGGPPFPGGPGSDDLSFRLWPQDTFLENGQMVYHPVALSSRRVPRRFYQGLGPGDSVAIRYTGADSRTFVFADPAGNRAAPARWFLLLWMAVPALILARGLRDLVATR